MVIYIDSNSISTLDMHALKYCATAAEIWDIRYSTD